MARGQIPTFGPQGEVGNVQLQTNIQGGYLNPGRPNVENVGKGLMQLADAGFKMGNALVEADVRAGKLADKAALIDAETLWAEYSLNKEMNYRGNVRGLGAGKGWAQSSINTNKQELAQFMSGNISLTAPPGVDQGAWTTRVNNLNAQLQKLRPESKVALQQFVGQQSTAWNANVTRYQISQAEAALAQQLKVKRDQAALAVTIAGPADFAGAMFNYLMTTNQSNQAAGAVSAGGGKGVITVDTTTVGTSAIAKDVDKPTNAELRGIITDTSPSKLFDPANMVAVKKVYFDEFQNKLNGLLTNNDFESARAFLTTYSDFSLSTSHPVDSRIVVPVHIQEAMQAKIVDAEKSGYFESAATGVVTQNNGALLADKVNGETDALAAAQALLGTPVKQMVDNAWVNPTPDMTGPGRNNITSMTQADVDSVKTKIRAKFATHNRQQAAVEEQKAQKIMDRWDSILAQHKNSNASGAAVYPQAHTYNEYGDLSVDQQFIVDRRWAQLNSGTIGAKGPTVVNNAAIAASWTSLPPEIQAQVTYADMVKIIEDNVPVSNTGRIGQLWEEYGRIKSAAPGITRDAQIKLAGANDATARENFVAAMDSASTVFKNAVKQGKEKLLTSYGTGAKAVERGKAAAILFESTMQAEYMERASRGANGDLTMDNRDVATLLAEVSRKFNTSIVADQGGVFSFITGYDYGELGDGQFGISQLTSPINSQTYSALSEDDRTTLKAAQVASFGDWNNSYDMGVVPPSAYLEVASLYAKSAPLANTATGNQASLQGLQLFTGNMHSWIEQQAGGTLQIGDYFEAAKQGSWTNSTVERRRELIYKMINATAIPTSERRARYTDSGGVPLTNQSKPIMGTRSGDVTAVSVYGPALMTETTAGQTLSAQDYINQQARLWAK